MLNTDPLTPPPPRDKHPSHAALIINANDVSGSSLNRETRKLLVCTFPEYNYYKDVQQAYTPEEQDLLLINVVTSLAGTGFNIQLFKLFSALVSQMLSLTF